jgi:hypothetical protein
MVAATALLVAAVLALSGCAPSATVNTQANANPVTQPVTAPVENPSVRNPEPAPFLPVVPPVAQPGTVVEPIKDKNGDKKGDVDWGEGMIHAVGKSAVDKNNTNTAQAILMAERGAVVEAQRNLLEITEGVRIDGETVVKDYITKSDIIFSRVEGVVKGARQIGDAKYDEAKGIVTVELVIGLYGEKGVSDVLEPERAPDNNVLPAPTPEVAKLMSKYSSIVIQGAGTNAKPALFPKLYDEKGNLILDTRTLVGSNATIGAGAVQFVDNLNSIINNPQLGSNPLVIKVKEVAGKYLSDYVIPADQVTILNALKTAWPYILKAGRFLFNLLIL